MKLAVWDVDGTLVDSRASIASAMDAAFDTVRLPAPGYDGTRAIVGMSLRPAIAALAPADTPDDVLDRLQTEYVNAFVKRRAAGAQDPLYDGARELLDRLKAEGWLMAVASGKSRAGLNHIFAAHDLETMFDTVHCADDGPGKPDPYMLICALNAMGAEASNAIMVGDTSHDMAMARAAGVYAQGVTWGFHTRDELHAGGAHHVADDFAALDRALAAFKR